MYRFVYSYVHTSPLATYLRDYRTASTTTQPRSPLQPPPLGPLLAQLLPQVVNRSATGRGRPELGLQRFQFVVHAGQFQGRVGHFAVVAVALGIAVVAAAVGSCQSRLVVVPQGIDGHPVDVFTHL